MATELTVLALAGLLQMVQFTCMAIPANLELGSRYLMGPRDREPDARLSDTTSRQKRALANHFEGLILFSVAVVVVTLGGQNSGLTEACAWLYLGARVLYVPAYALGLSPWRSLIWGVGFLATLVMLVAALV